jgi:hypothetical protein
VASRSVQPPFSGDSKKRFTPLFGTSLAELIRDDRRCGVAHMDQRLGIPTMVIAMLTYINDHIDTPGLFRTRVSRESIHELRFSLENERAIPQGLGGNSSSSVENMTHTVAAVLIQYLSELPEPLLGYEGYIGIHACQNIEEEGPRARNLSLFIQEAPWYNQPLLSKVISLFVACINEKHAPHNGLSLVSLAVLSTPFLLRSGTYLLIYPVQTVHFYTKQK